jgi:hypothetical protein
MKQRPKGSQPWRDLTPLRKRDVHVVVNQIVNMDSGGASILEQHLQIRCSPAALVFRNARVTTFDAELSHHSGLT